MRRGLSDLWWLLKRCWRIAPAACVFSFAEVLAQVLVALGPLAVGLLVGGFVEHRLAWVCWGVGLLIASKALAGMLVTFGVDARLSGMDRMSHETRIELAEALGSVPTLDFYADAATLADVQKVRDQPGRVGGAFNTTVNSLNHLMPIVMTTAIAMSADWRLIFVIIAALAALTVVKPVSAWEKKAEDEAAGPSRRLERLVESVCDPVAGAELRVFGARAWFGRRLRRACREWRAPLVRVTGKTSLLGVVVNIAQAAVLAGVLSWICVDAVAGRVSVGALATALACATSISDQFGGLTWGLTALAGAIRSAGQFRRVLALAEANRHPGTTPPPKALRDGIRLEGVDLRYPGSESTALTGVSLHLRAGETVAVVGENGAGKSTLAKLLTGMYTPSAGRVLIDGVPLAELDIEAWRAQCSGAFQDYLKVEDAAVTGITLGDLTALDDEDRAHAALRDAAATDVLTALPDGLATQLGGADNGGVDLSGGQWQRLAIARGMMRRHPLLLVLDEPTSALDPATEHALFEGYADAARQTGSRGGITLLITHRFSTVSAADRVVVLHEGRVAEVGTHTELMAAGGRYAELYAMQAKGYT